MSEDLIQATVSDAKPSPKHGAWAYYFSDDGETAEDARVFPKATDHLFDDAEEAAQIACELDFNNHDGWERGDREFKITIIAPDGSETTFSAQHEPSVEHRVYP